MEKGASNWLSALPLREHGFALHKAAFRDALCLRYGWRPPNLPERCVCGTAFSVEHAMSCPHGGFPIIRHNELRDVTAYLLSEVCHGVGIEPTLQPLANETLRYRTANREEGARLDIVAEDFWSHRQHVFFDVRVFNPFGPNLRNTSLPSCYRQKEQEKRRAYDQRIRDIDHGSFTPLIFSTSGGLGPLSCHSCIQEASCTSLRETRKAVWISHELDAMQIEFLSAQVIHHMFAWIMISLSSIWNIHQQYRARERCVQDSTITNYYYYY